MVWYSGFLRRPRVLETAKLVGFDPAEYLRDAALADARSEVLLPADMRSDRCVESEAALIARFAS